MKKFRKVLASVMVIAILMTITIGCSNPKTATSTLSNADSAVVASQNPVSSEVQSKAASSEAVNYMKLSPFEMFKYVDSETSGRTKVNKSGTCIGSVWFDDLSKDDLDFEAKVEVEEIIPESLAEKIILYRNSDAKSDKKVIKSSGQTAHGVKVRYTYKDVADKEDMVIVLSRVLEGKTKLLSADVNNQFEVTDDRTSHVEYIAYYADSNPVTIKFGTLDGSWSVELK